MQWSVVGLQSTREPTTGKPATFFSPAQYLSQDRRFTIRTNNLPMAKTSTLDIMNLSIDSDDLFRFAEEEFSAEPRQQVIDTLLRFSRSLEIRPSSLVGQIETVSN